MVNRRATRLLYFPSRIFDVIKFFQVPNLRLQIGRAGYSSLGWGKGDVELRVDLLIARRVPACRTPAYQLDDQQADAVAHASEAVARSVLTNIPEHISQSPSVSYWAAPRDNRSGPQRLNKPMG